jgi:hypothetical protein
LLSPLLDLSLQGDHQRVDFFAWVLLIIPTATTGVNERRRWEPGDLIVRQFYFEFRKSLVTEKEGE